VYGDGVGTITGGNPGVFSLVAVSKGMRAVNYAPTKSSSTEGIIIIIIVIITKFV